MYRFLAAALGVASRDMGFWRDLNVLVNCDVNTVLKFFGLYYLILDRCQTYLL